MPKLRRVILGLIIVAGLVLYPVMLLVDWLERVSGWTFNYDEFEQRYKFMRLGHGSDD